MCFLSKLFKKNAEASKPVKAPSAPVKQVPTQETGNKLSDMRHLASTGDPKLKGRHHTGSF